MKTVLILGASSGLGEQLVLAYKHQGDRIITIGRHTNPQADGFVELDLTSEKSIQNCVGQIQSDYAIFDTIILCSGIGYVESLQEQSWEHNEEVFKVNLLGPSYLLGLLMETIRTNKADVVFVGATIGFKVAGPMPMYSVSKWGLRGLIENMRAELGDGCRVIGVHPGGMNTESNIGPHGRETIIAQKKGKSVPQLMDSREVANHIVSLTSLPKNMETPEVIINKKTI